MTEPIKVVLIDNTIRSLSGVTTQSVVKQGYSQGDMLSIGTETLSSLMDVTSGTFNVRNGTGDPAKLARDIERLNKNLEYYTSPLLGVRNQLEKMTDVLATGEV